MKEKFNPKEWLSNNTNDKGQQQSSSDHSMNPVPESIPEPSTVSDNTEIIISRIEEAQRDITANYSDWLNLGFAFASEYGEAGRDYFQRISRFYPGYSASECDRKYDQCLKSSGQGITIKSFFHQAREAGIDIRIGPSFENDQIPPEPPPWPEYVTEEQEGVEEAVILPNLPESIFAELPEFLTRVLSLSETKEERDVLLLGAITVLGCCMPNMYGIYDGDKVHPNLYLFVTSDASAGKGRLKHCKSLVKPVNYALLKETKQLQQEHENKMREYNVDRLKDASVEKPVKPPQKMLFLPANCSAAGMFQLLSDNDGIGLIFETEGDTLALAFKSDHGNYSDAYRKAFHHESLTLYRKTDHEFIDIDNPKLSTVLAGTNKQVATLIPNAENGLLSRFIFYYMNIRPVWKNVFSSVKDTGISEHFNHLGYEYFKLYEALKASDPIQFCFTQSQKEEFHQFFSQMQEKYLTFQGMDYMATIRRLGLIAFRIAMIFNGLRILETGDFTQKQECQDVDFYASLAMIKVLIRHSSHVFTQLQEEVKVAKKANKKEQFFEMLPEKFVRQDFFKIAQSLSISQSSATKYISDFCNRGLIERTQHNEYLKKME